MGRRRCSEHEKEHWKQINEGREPSREQKRGDLGAEWRKVRERILNRDPICKIAMMCAGDVPSEEVDHIIPRAQGGTIDDDNLQGVCRKCHAWKTKQEWRKR